MYDISLQFFKKAFDGAFLTGVNRKMLTDGLKDPKPVLVTGYIPEYADMERLQIPLDARQAVVAWLQRKSQTTYIFPRSTELYLDGSMNIFVDLQSKNDGPAPAFVRVRPI